MFKSFSPEKVYALSMWIVSWVFASFLMGLGSLIIADLPKYDQNVNLNSINKLGGRYAPSQATQDESRRALELSELRRRQSDAVAAVGQANRAYNSENQAHQNWLRTREVTMSSKGASQQDPELIERVRALDVLQTRRVTVQKSFDEIEQNILQRENDAARERELRFNSPEAVAERQFSELKIFGMRLALTLPLLLAAWWLIARKRKSPYWPLARGFVLFAGSAFFFELVPYMPSYGGYVRYLVGIVICGVGSTYGIRWMQAYLVRRQEEEKRSEADRRSKMDKDGAIKKIDAGLCPGCERSIPKAIGDEKVNHCVYCGLKLFDTCKARIEIGEGTELAGSVLCKTRKNAFYSHCPECGCSSIPK